MGERDAVGERLPGPGGRQADQVASDREQADRPAARIGVGCSKPNDWIPFRTTGSIGRSSKRSNACCGAAAGVLDGFSDDFEGTLIRGEVAGFHVCGMDGFVVPDPAGSWPSIDRRASVALGSGRCKGCRRATTHGGVGRPRRFSCRYAFRHGEANSGLRALVSGLGLLVTRTVGRFVPDPFLLAIGLTA